MRRRNFPCLVPHRDPSVQRNRDALTSTSLPARRGAASHYIGTTVGLLLAIVAARTSVSAQDIRCRDHDLVLERAGRHPRSHSRAPRSEDRCPVRGRGGSRRRHSESAGAARRLGVQDHLRPSAVERARVAALHRRARPRRDRRPRRRRQDLPRARARLDRLPQGCERAVRRRRQDAQGAPAHPPRPYLRAGAAAATPKRSSTSGTARDRSSSPRIGAPTSGSRLSPIHCVRSPPATASSRTPTTWSSTVKATASARSHRWTRRRRQDRRQNQAGDGSTTNTSRRVGAAAPGGNARENPRGNPAENPQLSTESRRNCIG